MNAPIFQAQVVTGNDPLGLGRIKVLIPQVTGAAVSAWAAPTVRTHGPAPTPGSTVWVSFDTGDPSKPVYHAAGSWSPWTQAPQSWMASGWNVASFCYRFGPGGQVQWRGGVNTTISPVADGSTVLSLPASLYPVSFYPGELWEWPVVFSPGSATWVVKALKLTDSGVLSVAAGSTTFTGTLWLNLAPIAYAVQ